LAGRPDTFAAAAAFASRRRARAELTANSMPAVIRTTGLRAKSRGLTGTRPKHTKNGCNQNSNIAAKPHGLLIVNPMPVAASRTRG
jgi:hypothetical protein